MEYESLSELVLAVYEEIKDINTSNALDVVPVSTTLYPKLEKRFNLNPGKTTTLLDILVNSKMIFSFPVVRDDKTDATPRAFILTKGDVITKLAKRQNEYLEKVYLDETGKKVSADRLASEYTALRDEYDGKPLGIAVNIVMTLPHYKSILERNIFDYSDGNAHKHLNELLLQSPPLSEFIKSRNGHAEHTVEGKTDHAVVKHEDKKGDSVQGEARIKDSPQYDDFAAYCNKNPLEKTIKMYGAEFYSRVCFREYRFHHIQKIIEEDRIHERNELIAIKKLLDKVRINADNDPKLFEHADEINALVGCINSKLKGNE